MKLSCICIAAVLLGGPISGVSMAATQAATPSSADKAIESRIEKRIAQDKSLKDFSIKVKADDRVVTLSGTVPTEADRAKIGEIAKASGATKVENHIVADLDAASRAKGTSGKIEEKTGEAAAKTKEAGEKVVEKTKEGAEKTGEVVTDTWITSRIKTKMVGEDALKDSEVHVTTKDHVVTLTGYVKSAAGRTKAAEIAHDVEGVKEVVNRIAVK
jgi:osmotically-inducible protein OsmY